MDEKSMFDDLVDGVLGEESEANEQAVADQDGYEPEINEGDEQADEEEDKDTEDAKANEEPNLGIRFKKAKEKNEKLERELNELKERLFSIESKDESDKEKPEGDKQIDFLKQEIIELKKDKLRQENKLKEDIFYSEHPELAKEKSKHKQQIERFLRENPEIASSVVKGKVELEQVHVLMGGKPRSVINDASKVFGTAGINASNPRMSPQEKSAYETALEIFSKDEVTPKEFEFAQKAALEDISSFFLNTTI